MKRVFSLILALTAVLCLCACDQNNEPADCQHEWKAASCAAPKTCAKCGQTEGETEAHSFAEHKCSACGAAEFTGNDWNARFIIPEGNNGENTGEILATFGFIHKMEGYAYKEYYANADMGESYYDEIEHNGKKYYDYWFSSSMGGFTCTDNGNTVTVELMDGETKLTLVRTGPEQFTVRESTNEEFIPKDTVFDLG